MKIGNVTRRRAGSLLMLGISVAVSATLGLSVREARAWEPTCGDYSCFFNPSRCYEVDCDVCFLDFRCAKTGVE